jgi:SAM-dependent methyltransferase
MRESDIRPADLFKEYMRLSERDAATMFVDVPRQAIDCVACGGASTKHEFDKNGFGYCRCEECGTLYQSPRPAIEAFERFYVNSVSSDFWAREFFPRVADARRSAIIAPRAAELARMLRALGASPASIVDVGAGHGVFLSEIIGQFPGAAGIAVEPSAEMAASCRGLGFAVREALAEDVTDLEGKGDLVTSIEVIEHTHDPLRFLTNLAKFAAPGGRVFFTTLGADGFDVRVLGRHANAVFPPYHLNFMSVRGFEVMCRRAGLVDIEVLTPGKLDVDIVRNKLKEMPELADQQPFLRAIVADETIAADFQQFLASHRLSSHTWVLARKPDTDLRT